MLVLCRRWLIGRFQAAALGGLLDVFAKTASVCAVKEDSGVSDERPLWMTGGMSVIAANIRLTTLSRRHEQLVCPFFSNISGLF